MTPASVRARQAVLDRFAWVDGHADVWAVFRDARAARELIADRGAELVGCSVIVDQLADRSRAAVGRVHAVVHADELPDDGG